jgi:starch-binding outer membrane protein, SusD/RagB family
MRDRSYTARTLRRGAGAGIALRTAALLLGALLVVGCEDAVVPDLNNPSLEGVTDNPSRQQVQSLATGLVIGNRANTDDQVRDMEILGRDAYNLDAADPRWVVEMLIELDPGGFGSRHWAAHYRNIKGANVMVQSVETAEALSAEEKSAAVGYAQTIKALDLLQVLEMRDTAGIAADAGASPDELTPILCRDAGLTRIVALLDSANSALQAGGDAFPFVLPSGFSGFDDPTTFRTFNRALAAKAEIYLAKNDPTANARALAALGESFLSTSAPLTLGVYHVFSLASGDATNELYQDPATTNYRAHPSVLANAEPGDQRVAAKTEIGEAKTYQGVGSNIIFTVYGDPTSPIPIIRNEELILLRAQANIGAGDLEAARQDINFIRQTSGGLAPVGPFADADAAITELLRQKRYSLLFESGSHWVDARLYGRLGTLPIDIDDPPNTVHQVHPIFPIPDEERNVRGDVSCTQ